MSQLEVDKVIPQSGTTLTLGESGDTITIPSGATLSNLGTATGFYSNSDALTLFNASGSAPVYACRAWVNFNGSGTVAIRESGNVTSITDNGTGIYTVNFTTAMEDADYVVLPSAPMFTATNGSAWARVSGVSPDGTPDTQTTTAVKVEYSNGANPNTKLDANTMYVSIFR
jgi:hypothetical protein